MSELLKQGQSEMNHESQNGCTKQGKRRLVIIVLAALLVIALIVVGISLFDKPAKDGTSGETNAKIQQDDKVQDDMSQQEPQHIDAGHEEDAVELQIEIDMNMYNSNVLGKEVVLDEYEIICGPELTCTITRYTGSADKLEIPAVLYVNTIPLRVTAIGDESFWFSKTLEQVTIPEGVLTIGDSAFSTCRRLSKVKLPSTLESIGKSAFAECVLNNITIPANVTEVGEEAFAHNKSMSRATFEGSHTRIGETAFNYCVSLYTVVLPAELQVIEAYTFYGCQSLTNIEIPASVTSIGAEAFYIADVGRLAIPESVTSIGKDAFAGCKNLCIVAPADSYAYQYALDNRIAVDEP